MLRSLNMFQVKIQLPSDKVKARYQLEGYRLTLLLLGSSLLILLEV